MCHKFTFTAFLTGQILRVSQVGNPPERDFIPVRGEVGGFSAKSRKRMIEMMLRIDYARAGLPIFVTLTYPAEYPSAAESKSHLYALWERAKREFGCRIWSIWKIERQNRGAPHFHILMFCVDYLPMEWLSANWYEVVGSGDKKHLAAGTRVERIRSQNGAIYYASKYFAKTDDAAGLGRVWGVLGRKNAQYHETKKITLDEEEYFALRAKYEAVVGRLYYPYQGFSLYGRNWANVGRVEEE